jgi:hypothetical protein
VKAIVPIDCSAALRAWSFWGRLGPSGFTRKQQPVSREAGESNRSAPDAILGDVQNFRIQYERHLDLLRSHADAYDDGREHFAYEIATKIRVFVHDTFDRRGRPSSVSLLTHLGVKSEVGYVDWGPPETPPGAFSVGFGLCMLQMQTDGDGGTVSYVPARAGGVDPLRNHPLTSFVDWWRLPVLESHVTFTRAEFVLDVANQEGAHVDAKLNEKYARLTRQNALGVTTHAGGPPANPSSAVGGHADGR